MEESLPDFFPFAFCGEQESELPLGRIGRYDFSFLCQAFHKDFSYAYCSVQIADSSYLALEFYVDQVRDFSVFRLDEFEDQFGCR